MSKLVIREKNGKINIRFRKNMVSPWEFRIYTPDEINKALEYVDQVKKFCKSIKPNRLEITDEMGLTK